ncbi:AAA family ATPase [Aggregatibacter actinomycetemcomitans]|uniref:AAA domain-containing protein n=1 Tax=Aggregatibacter actinomycetemcomitans TaxID=714 RepID=UPI00197C7C89|nr:AAA domain-containing protein [Aggregatibacter actinomycetemcomitans]MBN6068428.1 AAA family ATPase [Aggregatibacter actinomycetemcomitans]MBN6085054.1 AAA family ATPase [Aggregatibacter actinomycetemcomitans]
MNNNQPTNSGYIYFRLPETEPKHKNYVTQEKLGKSIDRVFRSYKNLFPKLSGTNYEDIAREFCEMFFQFNSLSDGDTTIPVHLANLSLKDKADERLALSIRINSHPIFNEHISHKIAVAVIGFCPTATKNPIFIPERVILTHGQPEPTSYEQQVEAVFHQLEEGQYLKRGVPNLLTPEFTKSLPKYAIKTKARLASWLDFLSFKNKLIKYKTQGLRYLRWQFDEEKGQVHFLVIAENEAALKKARAAFSHQTLHTFKTEVSTEKFRFVLPKKETSSVDSAFSQLGQLANQGIKIIQKNNSDKEKLKACEHFRQVLQSEADEKSNFDFSKAVFADVFVDISEELSNRIAGFEDDGNREESKTRQEKINSLFKNMPDSGFLSISLVGDLALIDRHRRAVQNLQQNEGCYAPYLSSYLFDIENANQPNEIPEITEWENKHLNDKQKSAVQKMLAAPDICLIQGPPGTGKTTVIAEACLQFAKRGENVLLASQAHDALDNALSRLQNNPELRAIRLAKNANRITEEGKQFTGESVLNKHYVSLKNYVAQEYLQPFKILSSETDKLHEWVKQAEFVAHDLQHLRNEYRTNQGCLKQAEQALHQAQTEFAAQQDAFRRQSCDMESITQFIDLLHGDDPGEALRQSYFALPDTLYPLVEHLITEFSHLNISQPFSYERFLAESENQTAILYTLIQHYQRIQATLPKMEADLARLNSGNGTMGADTKTLLEIERLNREIEEIERQLDLMEDAPELSSLWRQKRKERTLLKEKPSEGLNPDTYQIFDDAKRFTQNNPEAVRPLLMQRIQKLKWFQQQYQSRALETVWDLKNQLQHYDLQPPSDETVREKQTDLESLKEAEHQIIERGRLKKQQAAKILSDGGFSTEADFLKEFAAQQNCLNALENELQTLQTQNQDFMPLFARWQEILKEPEKRAAKDWYELEKSFVESCNLVAITCNENEYTLTNKKFDGFDVVIIDEVSKATPLEMLLPLMRGKKAILVGDHRQLPPVFNEADGLTFEDEVEQNEAETSEYSDTDLTQENLRKYEKMVTASLFKELFEQAPESLRERLTIQFRMHPEIMNMINCFYEGQLTCGNPDAERPHGLTFGDLLSEKDHLLWVDTSKNEQDERFSIDGNQGNTNPIEAKMIARTLLEINRQLEAKGYGKGNKMKVGVVSFYQPQCRVIRDEIRKINKKELSFSAIEVEINTVIRYQGKEKPIILLSLVKNDGKDKNAYRSPRQNVARFEFINVAMSRAQNLLMVFGARNMLENREIKMPRMDKKGYDKKQVYRQMFNYLKYPAETGGICTAKEFAAVLPSVQPQQKGRK